MTVVRSLLGFRLLYLTGSVTGRLGFRVVHWKYILGVSTTVDPKDLQSITSAVVLSCTVRDHVFIGNQREQLQKEPAQGLHQVTHAGIGLCVPMHQMTHACTGCIR